MIVFLQYLAVVIALFGPKFGFIDSRLLLVPVMFIFYKHNKLVFSKNQIYLLGIIIFLLFYSLVLFLLFPSNAEFLRYFRSFISLFCLPCIIGYQNSFETSLKIVINVLIFHPVAIYLSMLFPPIQFLLADIFQFVAENRELRYNGLTAGYDIAGYLSISGFIICLYTYYQDKRNSNLIKSIVFYVSIFFTSRTSIIVLLFLSIVIFFQYLFHSKLSIKNKFFGVLLFTILSVFVYKYILPSFISTIDIEIFKNLSVNGNEEAVLTYAKTDPYQMLFDFVILPRTSLGLIFGENNFPKSDSGYIQSINAIGIFGLFFSLIFYGKIYFSLKENYLINQFKKNVSKALKIIIIITLLLCIKNQYIFTRGTFELIILIFIILQLPNNLGLKKINE
jgi:hypothetical protein